VVAVIQGKMSGIVDMDTLKKVNKDMVETLDVVIKISEEGSRKVGRSSKRTAQIQEELEW